MENSSIQITNDQPEKTATYKNVDTLDKEFQYYCKILPNLVPSVRSAQHVMTWISRLTSAECSIQAVKERRNRYLLLLCLTLQLGTVECSIFDKPPPLKSLPALDLVSPTIAMQSSWELDTLWIEQANEHIRMPVSTIKSDNLKCPVHGEVLSACPSNATDNSIGEQLDQHFQFFLHLARPYVSGLPQAMHRQLAATWLQTLCCIASNSCAPMKGVRNDYMVLLLGYLSSGMLLRPFLRFPTDNLVPLQEAIRQTVTDQDDVYDANSSVDEMLSRMPRPECGAFAFVGLSGDVCRH